MADASDEVDPLVGTGAGSHAGSEAGARGRRDRPARRSGPRPPSSRAWSRRRRQTGWIATVAALVAFVVVIGVLAQGRGAPGRHISVAEAGATSTSAALSTGSNRAGRAPNATIKGATTTRDRSQPTAPVGFATVRLSSLPPQATTTWVLIQGGGPFPYRQDGVVFENRDKVLPSRPAGWYHEYTVTTPGSSDRGARRLVLGTDHSVFYTADHYATFQFVDVAP